MCSFFSVFVIHPVVFSGGIVEGQIFSMHFGNFISAMRATPQSGKAHTVRDDLVEASCVSFASVQARKLNHYAASPLPTKPSGFAGSPRRASEKRTVGSLDRLHHAAHSAWTHNVWPARKTGCYALGLKAVKTPVTGCESCQDLSALFPIAGARAANTASENYSDSTIDYKRQKSEFQIYIATNVATMKSNV